MIRMRKPLDEFDIAVIGAGHAGIEAALAAARLGCKTVLFTLTLDALANLPCNPSIGGTAKGHLVCEIDALGGEMAKAADQCLIQSRMLNVGKGAAVHSLRAQIDRRKYQIHMKKTLEQQKNLYIKQAEIVDILTENGEIQAVETQIGAIFNCKSVIICTGTYLNGQIHVGEHSYEAGPDAVLPAKKMSNSLKKIGISLRRFKTGTPCRAHRRSIDFTRLERQDGDENIVPFSFDTKYRLENKVSCHIAYTNAKTHEVIRNNIHRSPLYSGKISGVGPRYCPSIEDKIVRFADKERHQIFVEPMGMDTDEMYLQGVSSSLPEEVQLEFLRTISGFENIEIMRPGYAIEYDCCDSRDLNPYLEFRLCKGLFGAGQFNGSSGYEEAAAQGLIAGINAAMYILGKEMLLLPRSSSYIGTLIDDLVTKGVEDPYRMMTSRSEYRLILRQDNADLRLMSYGHKIGLVSDARFEQLCEKEMNINNEIKRLKSTSVQPSEMLSKLLAQRQTTDITQSTRLSELLKRPQISYADIRRMDSASLTVSEDVALEAALTIKYSGYIEKQLAQVKNMQKLEAIIIPPDIDYSKVYGLRIEASEKLQRHMPLNIGQASRISGVSPADISLLTVYIESLRRKKNASEL